MVTFIPGIEGRRHSSTDEAIYYDNENNELLRSDVKRGLDTAVGLTAVLAVLTVFIGFTLPSYM